MRQPLLALVAGSITVLAFAPFNFWWIAPLSLGLLFYFWLTATPGRCFWLGFCWGFGLFITGISWVYISLQVYGQMPLPLAVIAVVGFVVLLSVFPGVAGCLQAWAGICMSRRARLLLLMPVSWVFLEWVRGWALTGFPWLTIGYTQSVLPLSGFAPVGGIYLVSLALAVSTAGLVLAAIEKAQRPVGVGCVLAVVFCGWALTGVSWVEDDGRPLQVAAVQANISLHTKWQQASRAKAVENYLSLSPGEDVDLVVWPETAVPWYVQDIPGQFWEQLEGRQGDYIFGTVEAISSGNQVNLYNSVIVMCGDERQIYRKQHLVPFGEYMPLGFMFGWILEYLHIPMSDFSSWDEAQPSLCAGGARVSVSVCYEDAFANQVRAAVGGSNLLVNVSEDAWFGDSLAPHQRLQMARMRVIETGRPMVRASNTGPSVVLDHHGNILARTAQFDSGVAKARVQPTKGRTPYVRTGDLSIIVFLVVVLLVASYRSWFRKK